jgi:cytochrome c oxidase subunit 1
MFTVGLGPVANSVFTITTMLIGVPTGIKIFNWIGTLWKGSIEFTTSMMFALGFVSLFIIGGLSGVSHAVSPSDFQQQDTYYIVAHLHYVLFGGSIMGAFAGIYYWYPKLTGRMLSETLGKLNFWLMFIGMNLTFFPMHYLGLNGMPRRIYTYSAEFGWENMNRLASLGYVVLFVAFLIFIVNLWQTRYSRRVSHDPWDAPGLEWSIASPPPPYNFAELPQVEGLDQYWIAKERARAAGTPLTEPEALVDPDSIHMPSPSYWPIFTAAGVALIGGGLLSHYAISFLGGAIAFMGVIGWGNEPATAPSDHH